MQHGTVMTDLILGLDPVDTPITDYERFGIRTGAADLLVTPGRGHRPRPRLAARLADLPGDAQLARRLPCDFASAGGVPARRRRRVVARLRRDGGDRVRGSDLGRAGRAAVERDQLQPGRDRPLRPVRRRARGRSPGVWTSSSPRCTPRPGPGLLELNLGARPRTGRGRRRRAREVRDEAGGGPSMGLRASFLAKTVPGEEGSSGHVHLSCWDGRHERLRGRGG